MISKTRISKRIRKKTNPELVKTLELSKKNNLLELAKNLSSPRSQYKKVNLEELDKLKEDNIMVTGKVLGSGNINRKFSISALSFSKQAKEKLEKKGCKIKTIEQEIESNKTLRGVKII